MERRPKRLRSGIVVGALAMSFLFACSSESTMPDLSGMREREASAALRESGIEDWTVKWAEGPNPLVVIDQEPDAGRPVGPETDVLISLSGE